MTADQAANLLMVNQIFKNARRLMRKANSHNEKVEIFKGITEDMKKISSGPGFSVQELLAQFDHASSIEEMVDMFEHATMCNCKPDPSKQN